MLACNVLFVNALLRYVAVSNYFVELVEDLHIRHQGPSSSS